MRKHQLIPRINRIESNLTPFSLFDSPPQYAINMPSSYGSDSAPLNGIA